MSSKSKRYSSLVDKYLIGYSILLILALLILLSYSLRYWSSNFPYDLDLEARMFYVAIGITFVTVISQWIEGRFKSILKTINEMKRRNLNGRRTKKETRN